MGDRPIDQHCSLAAKPCFTFLNYVAPSLNFSFGPPLSKWMKAMEKTVLHCLILFHLKCLKNEKQNKKQQISEEILTSLCLHTQLVFHCYWESGTMSCAQTWRTMDKSCWNPLIMNKSMCETFLMMSLWYWALCILLRVWQRTVSIPKGIWLFSVTLHPASVFALFIVKLSSSHSIRCSNQTSLYGHI